MIRISGLHKWFGDLHAVRGVDLEVEPGQLLVLLGQNGAGKSTTLLCAGGILHPDAGRIEFGALSLPADVDAVRRRLGVVPDQARLYGRTTALEYLDHFGRLYGVSGLQERIERLAADLDLGEFLDRPNGKLSAGQKTRVALAKALINRPELLLLDEPTASLDPDTADWVRQRLESYRKERAATILLASHNMLEVERLCDRVIIMKRGRIEDDDSPQAIMARYRRETLEEVFLDVARGRVQEQAS